MALTINLNRRRALITGVSSGIGAGIALALAEAGCAIAGCALEAATDAKIQPFLQRATEQQRMVYQPCDVTDAEAARQWVAWAAAQLGGIDIVVSNAGRNVFTGAARSSDSDWQANIDLNLAAHWRIVQAAKPFLDQAEQPTIIVIASNHAFRTLPGCFPYNLAKAGLVALVQSLALEWGPHIRAVGIAPGFIDTPLAEAWFNEFPDPAAKRAQIEGLHPIGRLGTPAEIGALCAFVASPLARFVNGTTLLIDGGRSAIMQDA